MVGVKPLYGIEPPLPKNCTSLTICFGFAQKIKDPLHCAGFTSP
jgi:hypothetical protein